MTDIFHRLLVWREIFLFWAQEILFDQFPFFELIWKFGFARNKVENDL